MQYEKLHPLPESCCNQELFLSPISYSPSNTSKSAHTDYSTLVSKPIMGSFIS